MPSDEDYLAMAEGRNQMECLICNSNHPTNQHSSHIPIFKPGVWKKLYVIHNVTTGNYFTIVHVKAGAWTGSLSYASEYVTEAEAWADMNNLLKPLQYGEAGEVFWNTVLEIMPIYRWVEDK